MTKETSPIQVFFLTRKSIFVYSPQAKVLTEIPIPESVIKDLEVKKIVELEKILTGALQGKIPTGNVFFVMGDDSVIDKVFRGESKDGFKEEIETQAKLAPFNHVRFGTRQAGKEITLVLVNRELYEAFQEILERLGYHIVAVVPAKFLDLKQNGFSEAVGKEIIKKTAGVLANSFILDPQQITEKENQLSSDPRRNKKLLALLIALSLLIIVFGGLVIKMTVFPDKAAPANGQPAPKSSAPAETSIPASTITPEANATPSAGLETVRIQILNASGKTGLAESVKTKLITSGFKLVEVGNAPTLNSDRLQIVFAPGLATNIRLAVVEALTGTFPNPAIRENSASGDFDVVISLTNSE